MAKKPNRKVASPEQGLAEERIEAIKAELAEAMVRRNALPKSASDEEKAAATACVEQLQTQHHEAVQHALAIKREETTQLEREHKEKKLRHKRLKASRQAGGHAALNEEPAASPGQTYFRLPVDREEREAQMDAANEADLLLERQRLEEEDRDSAAEIALLPGLAEKQRKKEVAAKRREDKKRQKKEEAAKAEAARLKAEKDARAKIRQQAALHRTEEAQSKKRQRQAEREARQRAVQDARPSGWFSGVLRQLKTFFGVK